MPMRACLIATGMLVACVPVVRRAGSVTAGTRPGPPFIRQGRSATLSGPAAAGREERARQGRRRWPSTTAGSSTHSGRRTGRPAVWGTVTRWEPPEAVAFTWHPGRSAERASHVTVTFAAAAEQTLVRLEHAGWEAFADPAAARAEYDQGWPLVLDCYQEYVSVGRGGETWVALLRLPGPDRLDVATRLATQDDASVAGGFLAVTVRPWQVMMQGGVPGGTRA